MQTTSTLADLRERVGVAEETIKKVLEPAAQQVKSMSTDVKDNTFDIKQLTSQTTIAQSAETTMSRLLKESDEELMKHLRQIVSEVRRASQAASKASQKPAATGG